MTARDRARRVRAAVLVGEALAEYMFQEALAQRLGASICPGTGRVPLQERMEALRLMVARKAYHRHGVGSPVFFLPMHVCSSCA